MQRNTIRNKVKYLALLALTAITLGIKLTSASFTTNILTGGSATLIIVLLSVICFIALAVFYVKFYGMPSFLTKGKGKKK